MTYRKITTIRFIGNPLVVLHESDGGTERFTITNEMDYDERDAVCMNREVAAEVLHMLADALGYEVKEVK